MCTLLCLALVVSIGVLDSTADADMSQGASSLDVGILSVEQRLERAPVLSDLIAWSDDDGERGAALGIADNNASGRFMGQHYSLETLIVEPEAKAVTTLTPMLADRSRLLVLNVATSALQRIADLPEAADDLLFNELDSDTVLRDVACCANVLHTMASRAMSGVDYADWAAVRTIGEAVTRTGDIDPVRLRDDILSDAFELAGFKGVSLDYRHWNGQLRQPIPLVHAAAVVATAPIKGYLHVRTELDTLGLDESESGRDDFTH